MKYFTQTIPLPLAEKLKEKGMPMMECFNITQHNSFSDDGGIHFYYFPNYATTFDWLMDRGMRAYIIRHSREDLWRSQLNDNPDFCPKYLDTWHEAANAAIEKALTLI